MSQHQQRYQTRSRGWCFTINNPGLLGKPTFGSSMAYLVFQLEKGESGTKHFQGYVYFKSAQTLMNALRFFSRKAHLMVARGTAGQNTKYCTKSKGRLDGPWLFGVMPVQGKRNDIHNVMALIRDGVKELQIAKEHPVPWAKYWKAFLRYRTLRTEDRDFKTRVVVLFGPTGTGKSRFAQSFLNSHWKQPGTKWYDGYTNQSVVVFDDFNTPWMKFDTLKRITDRYPLMVEIKGTCVKWRPHTLVITSNSHPRQWYSKYFARRPNAYAQLERRIDVLVSCPARGVEHWKFEINREEGQRVINCGPFKVIEPQRIFASEDQRKTDLAVLASMDTIAVSTESVEESSDFMSDTFDIAMH